MDLNDDCLRLIFEMLDLKDQIPAAIACQRFFTVMSDLWQHEYRCLYLNFYYHGITTEEFNVLIKGINDTVDELHLRDLTLERLEVLKLHSLPKLRTFGFTRWSKSPLSDDSVLDMTEMFPKLRSFSPHGPFSGKNMEKFLYLKHLKLSYCSNLKFSQLETILEELLLTSLELDIFDRYHKWTSERAFENFCELQKIFVNSTELIWLSKLWKFKHLKMLTIADRNPEDGIKQFLDNLCLYKMDDVIDIEANLNFRFYGNKMCKRKCVNLKKMVILNHASKVTDFAFTIKTFAPNLRKIIFTGCTVVVPVGITFILGQCDKIEYLSVEDCKWLTGEFKLDVKEIVKCRTKKIHFNFHLNYYTRSLNCKENDPVILNIIGSSPLLEITEDMVTPANFHPLTLKFR